ncbi:MAG: zf-HC2 domain-containing protein [Gemmatimonadaceae bacterium]|nr:zf-HC2 domain-containing protein [Gemmatimonadaceae bacterium]
MNDQNPGMLDCGRVMAQIFDLLDGEVTNETERRLREHITSCPHCFTQADFEERFLAALQEAKGKDGCPEKLRAKVMEALKAEGLSGTA